MKHIARTHLPFTVACLVLATIVAMSGCGKTTDQPAAAPLPVKITDAVQRDVPIYKEWVGQTYGAVDIEIRARVAGWLQGIHFREGTQVKQGALLYTIDQSELLQAVAEAKARVAQARTLMVRAKSDVDRYLPLAEAGAVSKRDLESAQAEYGARQGEVEAAQAQLNVAQINLGYATVYAPITGIIGISAARVGDFVGRAPNPVILNTVSRTDSIHVKFSISETEFLDLSRRFDVRKVGANRGRLEMLLADGTLYPERGSILFLQRQVDAATGTIQIEASFPNPGKLMRPGQFAKIRAVYDELKSAVLVPARAVVEIQGQSVLYTVDAENKAQFRRVVPGPKIGGMQVIEQGITAGEKVVVEGTQRLRPNAAVAPTPIPADSAAATPAGGGR